MLEEAKVCVACDCWGLAHYTPIGAGPFSGECWESLIDPDQALLLEKRVAAYELQVKRLKGLLIRAAKALEEEIRMGTLMPDYPEYGEKLALIEEVRRETL
jgi:hypothetical protein